jgi:transcriptional regulator
VAFEIEITQLENVFKLSQNRDEKSYENIIENLESQDEGAQGIANEMKKRAKDIFD